MQTGLLPGCCWQSHAKRIPGLFPALLLWDGSCACSCCPLGPCQALAVPSSSPVTLPGAQVLAVGLGSHLPPAAAPWL